MDFFEHEIRIPAFFCGIGIPINFCYFTLERLGVVEELKSMGFTEKNSVQFVTQDGRVSAPFYFFQHFDHPAATTSLPSGVGRQLPRTRPPGAPLHSHSHTVSPRLVYSRLPASTSAPTIEGLTPRTRRTPAWPTCRRTARCTSARRWSHGRRSRASTS